MSERENKNISLELLPENFFTQDSLTVAPALLGCVIQTYKNGVLVSGRIVETEAYPSHDAASHAFQGKRTSRTDIQFTKGGSLYVYQIMGLHLMTSIVVGEEGIADVVFIRSIEPLEGVNVMRQTRNYFGDDVRRIASGPGMLSVALGITKSDSGTIVYGKYSHIKLFRDSRYVCTVERGKRINLGVHGVSQDEASKAVEQPWRFFDPTSKFLSKHS